MTSSRERIDAFAQRLGVEAPSEEEVTTILALAGGVLARRARGNGTGAGSRTRPHGASRVRLLGEKPESSRVLDGVDVVKILARHDPAPLRFLEQNHAGCAQKVTKRALSLSY